MKSRIARFGLSIAGAIVVVAAAPAGAGTLYRWETADGTIAFADEAKRIPERYRAQATEIQTQGGLDDYDRFTPTDAAAQDDYAERLNRRLESLRAQSEYDAADGAVVIEEPPAQHPLEGIALQTRRETVGRRLVNTNDGPRWRRTTRMQTVDAATPVLGVQPDPNADEPVIVERMRARSRDSLVTRHVTVVRQGDRVLSVIKPKSRWSSANFPIEEELEASR